MRFILNYFFHKNICMNQRILFCSDSLPRGALPLRGWRLSCQKVYCLPIWSRNEGDPLDLVITVLLYNIFGPFLIVVQFYLQRHNAIEHGGRMSRAKRNAVLQACMIFLVLVPRIKFCFLNWLRSPNISLIINNFGFCSSLAFFFIYSSLSPSVSLLIMTIDLCIADTNQLPFSSK